MLSKVEAHVKRSHLPQVSGLAELDVFLIYGVESAHLWAVVRFVPNIEDMLYWGRQEAGVGLLRSNFPLQKCEAPLLSKGIWLGARGFQRDDHGAKRQATCLKLVAPWAQQGKVTQKASQKEGL